MFKHILLGSGIGLLLASSALAARPAAEPGRQRTVAAAKKSQPAPVVKAGALVPAKQPTPAPASAPVAQTRAPAAEKQARLFSRWEGEPHVFTVAQPHPIKVLFFHGAGQPTFAGDRTRPPNELIARIADALKTTGLQHEIHSMPWETNPGAVIDWLKQQEGRFIISGHSAGGAFASWLTREMPEKFIASFLINPAGRVRTQTVPTLLVRGTRDYMRDDKEKNGVTLLAAEGADHSLRYRLSSEDDKATAEKSPETRAMNLTVARAVTGFLGAQLQAAPLKAAR